MSEWETIAKLKNEIMALPGGMQGPLIAELCVLTDKLFGIGVLLEDLESNIKRLKAQKTPSIVQCYICGRAFSPNADKMKKWAESGRQFDPTDWACVECLNIDADQTIFYMEAVN